MITRNKMGRVTCNVGLILALLIVAPVNLALADGPPTVSVAAPSNEIGDVGAALGNVWNMDSLSDVTWTQPGGGSTISYQLLSSGVSGSYGSVLQGETPEGSDLATAFYTNGSVSIPTDIYHHLLYRVYVPHHQSFEAGYEFTNGRILYASEWSSNWYVALATRRYSDPYGMCGYGTWCLYYFDLATSSLGDPGSPNPWDWGQPGAKAEAFGLWVHENWVTSDTNPAPSGDSPEYFYLDYVYLTGDIVARSPSYTYTVKWDVGDPDGGTITSTLYYQQKDELQLPSQSPMCDASLSGWTLISGSTQNITVSPSASYAYSLYLPILFKSGSGSSFGSGVIGPYNQSYTWDLSSLEVGKVYYICVEARDSTGNKGYAVSTAPVIKAAYYPPY